MSTDISSGQGEWHVIITNEHVVVKNGNFTCLMTLHGKNGNFPCLLTFSGQEWQYLMASGQDHGNLRCHVTDTILNVYCGMAI